MGDIRRDERSAWVVDRVVATNSLVLKTIGGGRRGEIATGRFVGNEHVDPAMILAPHVARTRAAATGCRVVVAQDTTEVNFAGRGRRRNGLGPAGDGVSPGFFIHPQIAIDAASGSMLGIVGAEIWTRAAERVKPRTGRALADKESQRWLTGMETAAAVLGGAASGIIVVGDRENDIYEVMAGRPQGVDFVIRAAQDRALEEGGQVKTAGADWPVLARENVDVPARRAGEKGGARPRRLASVEIRAGSITVRRPRNHPREPGHDPADSVALGLVIVSEPAAPAGVEPLQWRLLTTLPVTDAHAAREVIRLYRLRWRIEETFRTLKTDGLDIEASQVTEAHKLFNLAAIGLVAAVRIMQLVDARDGSTRPATDVIDAAAIPAVAKISDKLEGRTARQKNPHAVGSLAQVSWVCARLGGWNCYYRPPGPKTMAAGWRRLADRLAGFALAEGG